MSEWGEEPLNQLADFQKGRKVDTSEEPLEGYRPYLGAGSLVGKSDGFGSGIGAVTASDTDVLMLWDGERSGLVGLGRPGIVSSTVMKLSPSARIDVTFLYYFLALSFDWVQNRRTGTGVPHVPKDLGKILRVKYPKDPDHQKKIADILETVDEAIEQTEALIAKYKQIKAGMMQDLFTRGLKPDGKLRPPREDAPHLYQETPIGWIPKDWEFKSLRSVILKIDSGWSPDCIERTPTEGEWGVLKVSAVTRGAFDPKESKTLPDHLPPKPSLEVRQGDVVLTRANGVAELVGKCVQVKKTPSKLMLSDKLLRLVPDEDMISKEFLAMVMSSEVVLRQIDKVLSGSSGQRNISQSQIFGFCAGRPRKVEQSEIALRIEAVESSLVDLKSELQKLRQQKAGLMADLLTGKTPVKV